MSNRILEFILQHLASQQAPPPVYPLPQDPQAQPITSIVQALTNGGGQLNKIKNARNERQQAIDALSNL